MHAHKPEEKFRCTGPRKIQRLAKTEEMIKIKALQKDVMETSYIS